MKNWREINIEEETNRPKERNGTSSIIYEENIYIFGGNKKQISLPPC